MDGSDDRAALAGSAPRRPEGPTDPASFIAHQSQSVIVPSSYLTEAFREVVARDLDRRMVLALWTAGRELRYEELRRRVGNPAPQAFGRAVERLSRHALINRRLQRLPRKRAFGSFLSPSPWGITVAKVLDELATKGRLPPGLDADVRVQVKAVFQTESATEARPK